MKEELDGWLPVRIFEQAGELRVDWRWFGTQRLLEPFFEQSVDVALRRPFTAFFGKVTGLDLLLERADQAPGIPPSGFVFHMSRCGSTLVSQMLAARADTVVASEPSPLDGLLRAGPLVAGEEELIRLLRALVSALAAPRGGGERHFVLKLDAWSSLRLPLIRRAFPGVPWVFVVRDPVEVLVSQLRRRGIHTVPSLVPPTLFGIDPIEAASLSQEEYVARILGAICRAGAEALGLGGGVAIRYEELPETLFDRIAPFFGIPVDESTRRIMEEATSRDAKEPRLPFAADSGGKQAEATDRIRELAQIHLAPFLREMEAFGRFDPASLPPSASPDAPPGL